MTLPLPCPTPPGWTLDWPALTEQFEWIRAMQDCPQDAIHHAEGNVWIHTGMVCEALATLDAFRNLPEHDRQILFAAALLHDVAKPSCTRHENGRITSRGHSPRGAIDARRILWELGADFAAREQVCALVRYHQHPYFLIDRPDAQRTAFLISQTARCDLLATLAQADVQGRVCTDQNGLLTRIELFREFCREQGCLHAPKQLPSNHSRWLYFRNPGRNPDYLAHEDHKCRVTLMSGLPGAGKDTWIAQHLPGLPQVSLDAIREESGIEPTGEQGAVVQTARDRARALLRAGHDFVWNATNLSAELRSQTIGLFAAYRAHIRIVYVESSHERYFAQNRRRQRPVPDPVIRRLLDRWEVPDPTEAHETEYWIDGRKI